MFLRMVVFFALHFDINPLLFAVLITLYDIHFELAIIVKLMSNEGFKSCSSTTIFKFYGYTNNIIHFTVYGLHDNFFSSFLNI